jgi:hypothetical protein
MLTWAEEEESDMSRREGRRNQIVCCLGRCLAPPRLTYLSSPIVEVQLSAARRLSPKKAEHSPVVTSHSRVLTKGGIGS